MITDVEHKGEGRIYTVTYNHLDDLEAQLANAGAKIEKKLAEGVLSESSWDSMQRTFDLKKALEGFIIFKNIETDSVEVLARDQRTEDLVLYKHAEKFLENRKAMTYRLSYQEPFWVSIPSDNSESLVTQLPEEEFNTYLAILSEHMLDSIETFYGKPTKRNQNTMMSSAQSIKDLPSTCPFVLQDLNSSLINCAAPVANSPSSHWPVLTVYQALQSF